MQAEKIKLLITSHINHGNAAKTEKCWKKKFTSPENIWYIIGK